MTTRMSGTSVAERNLDRLTIIVRRLWLLWHRRVAGLVQHREPVPDAGTPSIYSFGLGNKAVSGGKTP